MFCEAVLVEERGDRWVTLVEGHLDALAHFDWVGGEFWTTVLLLYSSFLGVRPASLHLFWDVFLDGITHFFTDVFLSVTTVQLGLGRFAGRALFGALRQAIRNAVGDLLGTSRDVFFD